MSGLGFCHFSVSLSEAIVEGKTFSPDVGVLDDSASSRRSRLIHQESYILRLLKAFSIPFEFSKPAI